MPSERDTERALSIKSFNRSEVLNLVVGENDTARVLFSPGGNLATQGAPGSFYSALWLSGVQSSLEARVTDAGALEWIQGSPFTPTNGRWPINTRYAVPTQRTAASVSLALRGPGDNIAEFYTKPRAGFQLCDSDGVGWSYLLNLTNNAVVPQPAIPLATQRALISNPAWFRQDGRVTIGSGRGHGGSLQVTSYVCGIQVKWNGLATYITMVSPSGAQWNVQPDTAGVLTVTAG